MVLCTSAVDTDSEIDPTDFIFVSQMVLQQYVDPHRNSDRATKPSEVAFVKDICVGNAGIGPTFPSAGKAWEGAVSGRLLFW